MAVGLGRQSQGMSTALAVEKTSKRGGKIINVAAERGMCAVHLYSHENVRCIVYCTRTTVGRREEENSISHRCYEKTNQSCIAEGELHYTCMHTLYYNNGTVISSTSLPSYLNLPTEHGGAWRGGRRPTARDH